MKSMPLTAIRHFAPADLAEPEITHETDVLFRVDAVGVCGSDIHYYRTGRIGDQQITFPFLVGHECSGTVVETGAGVTRIKPGDRIAVDPAVSCGVCDQCRTGRTHTCRDLRFMGCPGQLDGCLSGYYVLPESCCFPVSDDLSPAWAALVEPLSIGCYAARQGGLTPGRAIGIYGLGPIGLSVMLAARAIGITQIAGVDPLAYRRQIAEEHGLSYAFDPMNHKPPSGQTYDVVFDCCGEPDILDEACHRLNPGGTLVLVGIPETAHILLDPHILRRREVTIKNVRRQNGCIPAAIDLVQRSDIDCSFMLTHTFHLSETQKAFDLVDGYSDQVIKAMIVPD